MNPTEKQTKMKNKQIYEEPIAQAIVFSSEDIITTSAGDNLGEWDPQLIGLE